MHNRIYKYNLISPVLFSFFIFLSHNIYCFLKREITVTVFTQLVKRMPAVSFDDDNEEKFSHSLPYRAGLLM